jgi:hypothetical protein
MTISAIDFLRMLRPQGPWAITAIVPDGPTFTHTFMPGQEKELNNFIARQNVKQKQNIYYTLNVTGCVDKKPTKADITHADYLHVDADPEPDETPDEFKARMLPTFEASEPKPKFIVVSGNGLQGLFPIMRADCTNGGAAVIEEINAGLADRFGAARGTQNIDRLLRLPGTINHPNKKKRDAGRKECRAELIAVNNVPPYDPANLTHLRELAKIPSKAASMLRQRSHADRSALLFAYVNACLRAKVPESTIIDAALNSNGAIRQHIEEQNQPAHEYMARQVQQAKTKGPETSKAEHASDDADLAEMNERYAVVKVGGKTRVVEFEESATYPGCRIPVFSSIADFCAFHAKKKKRVATNAGSKEVGLGRWWIDHTERRQYDRVAYLPGVDNHSVMNLWQGFAVEPKQGDCDLYLTHLRENVCRGDQEHYDYLINWMANGVQYPGQRCESAIVLRGKEGVGKGIVARYFGGLFGSHYRHISQPKHLVGHFNAHLQQCSVLFADEAFFAGDRAHEGILKALISEPVILVEPKGVDPFTIPNTLHIIMSSNADWVIPASAEARRFAVYDVAATHMQDRQYFRAITEQMENGGCEALLHLLLHRDLSNFDVRTVPQTNALAEQKAHSRRGIDRLVEILAHEGVLPCADASDPSMTHTTGEDKSEGFYAAARKLAPDLKHQSSKIMAGALREQWGCKRWKSGYHRGIQFPPLQELRARFDQRHGKQEWPDELGPAEWGK